MDPLAASGLARFWPRSYLGAVSLAERGNPDLIDFYDERDRHKEFFGRQAVLAEIDASLRDGRHSGWLLLQGVGESKGGFVAPRLAWAGVARGPRKSHADLAFSGP